MEMQGQSVIVTGGASGIGKATALLLAREAQGSLSEMSTNQAGRRQRRKPRLSSWPLNTFR